MQRKHHLKIHKGKSADYLSNINDFKHDWENSGHFANWPKLG